MTLQCHLFSPLIAPALELQLGVRNTKNEEHFRSYSGGGGGAGVQHLGLAGPPGPTVEAAAFCLHSTVGTIWAAKLLLFLPFSETGSLPFLLAFRLISFFCLG